MNIPPANQLPTWLTPDEKSLITQAITSEGVSIQDLQKTSYKRVRDGIGNDAKVVLIGEATHGTEEFYRIRADLTKTLLQEDGFDAVLCEGDFPPFFQLNRYVGGAAADYRSLHPIKPASQTAVAHLHREEEKEEADDLEHIAKTTTVYEALAGFRDRFPQWMFLNNAMADFATWLRDYNSSHRQQLPVQLLGMDIYSLFQSADEVIAYLKTVGEVKMAQEAEDRYSVFNNFRPREKDYGRAVNYHAVQSQEDNVARVLDALISLQNRRRQGIPVRNGHELFNAIQNARVVVASESYYREMYLPDDKTWNLRDSAFLDAVQDAMAYIMRRKIELNIHPANPRVIIWAHNSHVGDASATEHGLSGEYNIGQLCRQVFGKENCYTIGFTSNGGTVRAASEWGGEDSVMNLNPAMEGSHEYLMQTIANCRQQNAFAYTLRSNSEEGVVDVSARDLFHDYRLERFVGTSYRPETEARSHYSSCILSDQFDCIIHVDRSSALQVDRVVSRYGGGGSKAYEEKENMMLLDAYSEDYGDLVVKKA